MTDASFVPGEGETALHRIIFAQEARLSRDRQAAVWLLVPLAVAVLWGVRGDLWVAFAALAFTAVAALTVGRLAVRAHNGRLVRAISQEPPALPRGPQWTRLLLGALPLVLAALWTAAYLRTPGFRALVAQPPFEDEVIVLPTVLFVLVLLVSGVAMHWLEFRDWRSRARLALMQLCDTDSTALMRADGFRWAWWWGWREAWGMARNPAFDGLADSVANVALALALVPLAAFALMVVALVFDPLGGDPWVLAGPLGDALWSIPLVGLPSAALGLALGWIWPTGRAARRSGIALLLSLIMLILWPGCLSR